MNQQEQLSAFMDGELSTAAQVTLSNTLLQDAKLQQTFGRYQKIRQSLHHESGPDATAIAARVQAALAQEPMILAPKPSLHRLRRIARPRTWGLALAATLALLAIGVIPQLLPLQPSTSPPIAQTPASPPAYLDHYLSEHHAYVGASHVAQPSVQRVSWTYVD